MITRIWPLLLALCLWQQATAGNLYLRFQLLSPVKAGVYAGAMAYVHHPPYFVAFRSMPPSGAGYPGKWVKTGQYSPWTEISDGTLAAGENTVILTFRSAEEVANIDVAVEIAGAPDPAAVIAGVKGATDHDVFSFLLPGTPQQGQALTTIAERSRDHLRIAQAAFPDPPPTLRHLTIDTGIGGFGLTGSTGGGWSPVYRAPQIFNDELATLRRYGFNALSMSPALADPYALDAGFTFLSNDCGMPIQDVYRPDYAARCAAVVNGWAAQIAAHPRLKDRVYDIRLADEPGLIGHDWAEDAAANARFRDYLRERGVTPADFGLRDWPEVRLVLSREQIDEIARLWSDREAAAAPLLYYHSKKFQSYSSWLAFKIGTEAVRQGAGPAVLTSINPSPHPVFGRGMLSSNSLDWIEGGRMGATTMPWTEDWLGVNGWVAFSVEHVGFLADLLRAAGKYHNDPLGMYLIPVGCNSYLATTQKTFTALGRGVTHLNYFLYGPTYAATCDYYSENTHDLRAIGDAARKLVAVEQDLVQARYRQPEVAILWPVSAEIWQDNNIYNAERQLLWLLLDRHQIPVDFLTEEDLEDGRLAPYRVVFAVGDCLTRKAGQQLTAWVNGGGQLWLSPGTGLYDEYRRDHTALTGLTGFRADALQIVKTFGGWGNVLGHPQPLATVKPADPALPALPALFARQDIATTGQVLATFPDGKSALARQPAGKGNCWQAGFLLGLAYGAGSNKQDNNGFATVFPEDYARWLEPLLAAGGVRLPLTVDRPGIQATLLESPAKRLVVLTDYTRDPQHGGIIDVTVRLPGSGNAKRVTSAAGAKLTIVRKGADLQITLPLDIADVLVVENANK